MPDFNFQKSRCYVSPSDHQYLLDALPNVNEPHFVTSGGGSVERVVCRLPDDRIWIQGPHESKKLAWVKMSASSTTPSAQLSALRPFPYRLLPTPLGVPSDFLAQDPNIIHEYEALAQAAFGPEATTLCEAQFTQPNQARQDTVRPAAPQPPPIAGPSNAPQPQWHAAYIPSVIPQGLLETIAGSWAVGAYADIVSPDGQLRRFQHQGPQITATDLMNNSLVVAHLA